MRRVVDDQLDAVFPDLPAVMIEGPKAVGKTATAVARARTTWQLDRMEHREIVQADNSLLLTGTKPVLIDEWQRIPEVWDAIRRAVDSNPVGGQFLLTGSAPPRGVTTHSGAGRIPTIRMRPLTLPERGVSTPTVQLADLLAGTRPDVNGTCPLRLADYTQLLLRSGFPALQQMRIPALHTQLDGYLDRIIEAEVEEMGLRVKRPAVLRSWLRAYAAATGTTASWERIRSAASSGLTRTPARSTTEPYVDVLTRLHVLDELDAWIPSNNHLLRVGQASKHYLADPALAARLLGLQAEALLRGEAGQPAIARDGTFLGALFEALAVMSIRVFAESQGARVSHLRMKDGGHEIDIIVEVGNGAVLAIEVKLSQTVDDHDVKHLRWLQAKLGADLLDSAVITTGTQAYRRRDGIAVVPLGLLGP